MENLTKVILPSGNIITSDEVTEKVTKEISGLLGLPIYVYKKIGFTPGIELKYRGVCGCTPEFGHDQCLDCFYEYGGPDEVKVPIEIPFYDWVKQ